MSRYFLGVDIGATKSHALITNEEGKALGLARGGAGNHETVGYAGTTHVLNQIVHAAAADAGITVEQISGAGFGIGGYDWHSELGAHMQAIDTLGLRCPVQVVNDAIIGLVAGAEAGWGVALVAGTGNNCRGWDRNHREGRVTGNGSWFGENGGSGELVMRAVQAVVKQWTCRGPATSLTQTFMQHVGARGLEDLIEGLSQDRYQVYAAEAPLVFATAAEGDVVAKEVITWAAEELASLANGVIRQLNLEEEHFDIVLVGSLYNGGEFFTGPLFASIHAVAPHARFVRLAVPPVVGAVIIGMEAAGLQAATLRPALIASAKQIEERVTA